MPPTRRKPSSHPSARRSQQTLAFGPPNSTAGNKITKASQPAPPTTAGTKKKGKTLPSDADRVRKALADAVSTSAPESHDDEEDDDGYPPPPEKHLDNETRELAIRKGTGTGGEEEDVKRREEAAKVSEAQIKRYWKGKESERIAPRVHQAGLSVEEKILRHFDLSSLYGPCIGIPRLKRWKRASNLGLNPPVEVLAVLLKEEKSGNGGKAERAFMEGLLTSRLAVNE